MNIRKIPLIAALASAIGLDRNRRDTVVTLDAAPDFSGLRRKLLSFGYGKRSNSPIPPNYFRSPGWKQKQRRKKARRLGLH